MTNEKHISYKLWLVAGMLLVFGAIIVGQLVKIQMVDGDQYKLLGENTFREFEIPANRGNLYDANGNLLATSVPKYDIGFDAKTVYESDFEEFVGPLSEALSQKLGQSRSHWNKKLRLARANNKQYIKIASNLSYSDYLEVKDFPLFKKGPYRGGFVVHRNVRREYPLGKMAERTVGYDRLDADGNRARAGMEGAFGELLRGHNGMISQQKIARGEWKPITPYPEVEPVDGYDVYTTIDVNIQDIAHHALLRQLEKFEADHGSVIVMDVQSGEIKALANLGQGTTGKYYERLNYAVGTTYEPGSTFKLMAMVAALNQKVIDTSDIVDTENGRITIYGRHVNDSKYGGYGKISAARGFELSSNTALVKLIYNNYKNNPDKFVDALYAMGLNKPTGIPIVGEGIPNIPHPNDEGWSGLSLPWMSFGYGVEMTPLQTLTFYNAIANNGVMVKPRLIRQVRAWDTEIETYDREILNPEIASPEVVAMAKTMMENVVIRGTADNIYLDDFSMAGKTGTCKTEYWFGKNEYIASFAGYFPANKPRYSCIVVINKPNTSIGYYGNVVAAPVFKEIAIKIFSDTPVVDEIDRIGPCTPEIEDDFNAYYAQIQNASTTVPNLKGMTGMDAIALCENLGLNVVFEGSGIVKSQSLEKGVKINNNQEIKLILG